MSDLEDTSAEMALRSSPLRANLKCFRRPVPESAQRRFVEFKALFSRQLHDIASQVYPREPSIAMQLLYLGHSEADPALHLIIQCDKAAAGPVKRFLVQDHVRDQFRGEFLIRMLTRPPRELRGGDSVAVYTCHEFYAAAEIKGTLCGMPIIAHYNDRTVSARLGGVVMTRDKTGKLYVYGMTAGHLFKDLQPQDKIKESNEELDAMHSSGGVSFEHIGDGSDSDLDLEMEDAFETTKADIDVDDPSATFIFGHTSKLLTSDSSYDWCLIDLAKGQCYPNLRGTSAIIPADQSRVHRGIGEHVQVLSGQSASAKGILIDQSSAILCGGGQSLVETYDLVLDDGTRLRPSDSGSWVVSKTDFTMHGHIVGANAFGDAYVVPIQCCLKDIESRLGHEHAFLPSKLDIEAYAKAWSTTDAEPDSTTASASHSGVSPDPISDPIPRETRPIVRQDQNGVYWLAFEYSLDQVKLEYTVRCDVESVDVDKLPIEFQIENCAYPGTQSSRDHRYYTECNRVGWALVQLNPMLRGKRGLIQRAVKSWQNTKPNP